MVLTGDLGMLDPAWAGWHIAKGLLWSPEGWDATPGHVRAMKMMNRTLAVYRRENEELKAAVRHLEAERDKFEDQPLPTQWEIAAS